MTRKVAQEPRTRTEILHQLLTRVDCAVCNGQYSELRLQHLACQELLQVCFLFRGSFCRYDSRQLDSWRSQMGLSHGSRLLFEDGAAVSWSLKQACEPRIWFPVGTHGRDDAFVLSKQLLVEEDSLAVQVGSVVAEGVKLRGHGTASSTWLGIRRATTGRYHASPAQARSRALLNKY